VIAFDSCSDAVLLAGTRADPDAFAAFYRRYERLILGYLLRRTRNPEVAADLTAEVFASALRAAGRYLWGAFIRSGVVWAAIAYSWMRPPSRSCLRIAAAGGLVMVGGGCRGSGGASSSARCGLWLL